ncbi:MAG: PrsW family intramembrane metalloprotease [Labilithrix sp.]|nr:PrsW family intramembrane metalloprotease [Labilithrix sp.]
MAKGRVHELLYTPAGAPRFVLPAIVALVMTFAIGWGLMRAVQQTLPDEERATALSHTRKFGTAEAIYVRLLRERPSVDLVVALLNNHERARAARLRRALSRGVAGDTDLTPDEIVMSDEALDGLIEALPPDVALVGRFWRAANKGAPPEDLTDRVTEAADRDPPLAFTNHALARRALKAQDYDEAAKRFEREGVHFRERASDVDVALALWMKADAWDHVRARLADPRVAAAAGPSSKYRFAVHERDWRAAVKWLFLEYRPAPTKAGLILSGVAMLAWAFFCARLGKIGDRWKLRAPLYLFALALGVLSIAPTVLLIAVEEAQLKLVATGDPARDVIYFVFGVGLREEASKLLLFLPLVPILRKWGDRLDVLVCGAFVGLGFAAEENLNYLASGDIHAGLGRFLTANFFHMALTGTLAAALDDFLRDREKYAADFSRTALMIVGMHGAYDFLLSHDEFGGGYFAMGVYFFLVRMFLGSVDAARRRADRVLSLTHVFVLALAVVTGTCAVYAVSALGPTQGALVLAEGLLGVAILIYAFIRTLREI